MIIYRFERKQIIKTDINTAWSFFSDPNNLAIITPPSMEFNILQELPKKMFAGMIINYTVKPFSFFKVRWTTEIVNSEENKFFIDEQRFGPYKFWYHQHFFKEVSNSVEMTDVVYYALPFGFLGRIFGAKIVENKLNYIFEFRKNKINEIFK